MSDLAYAPKCANICVRKLGQLNTISNVIPYSTSAETTVSILGFGMVFLLSGIKMICGIALHIHSLSIALVCIGIVMYQICKYYKYFPSFLCLKFNWNVDLVLASLGNYLNGMHAKMKV